jgi:hypothetical protein
MSSENESVSIMQRLKAYLLPGLVLVLYVSLSLIYFRARWKNIDHMYFGGGQDPGIFIWCLNWWPWAIAHGLNPFVSDYVWYPNGFDMTWATSVPSAALVMAPLTRITNALVSFNVLTLAAPALSSWVTFLFIRYLTKDTAAALIGGYLFGFSSYELGALLGHLHLDLSFVVPLCVWLVVQRVRNDLSRWRFVALLAAALLAQLGFSTEILATMCVLGAVAWAIFLIFADSNVRQQLYRVAAEIIMAAVITCGLGAPFLFYVLKDMHNIPQINPPEVFSAEFKVSRSPGARSSAGVGERRYSRRRTLYRDHRWGSLGMSLLSGRLTAL